MVILWKKEYLVVNYNFIGPGYVGINVSWGGCGVNVVNVYASCSINYREGMWNSLLGRRIKGVNEEWCIDGDFNEITCRVERKGVVLFSIGEGWKTFVVLSIE